MSNNTSKEQKNVSAAAVMPEPKNETLAAVAPQGEIDWHETIRRDLIDTIARRLTGSGPWNLDRGRVYSGADFGLLYLLDDVLMDFEALNDEKRPSIELFFELLDKHRKSVDLFRMPAKRTAAA
jgi:hypothetical protein